MITVYKSKNADSRTSNDVSNTDKLREDTYSHQRDVQEGMFMIADLIKQRSEVHDHTKIDHFDDFAAALASGHIKDSNWYRIHTTQERHHLKTRVPDDVNLIDVVEHVVDCTMAGLARSGTVYDLDLDPEVLRLAIENTKQMIIDNVELKEKDEPHDVLDEEI